MKANVALRIRQPFLLDASMYITLGVMTLLGISGLTALRLQIIAVALCLTCALLYRFVFRTEVYLRNPSLYFGAQAGVLCLLFLLKSSASDAFNFIFYMLTVQLSIVLDKRSTITWTSIYFLISASVSLLSRGVQGIYAVFFYLVAFVVCAIMGHTLQQTELTNEHNEKLVEELKQTQQKLQELAVVEERNRLARDLHDSVKQQVFAISMQLSAARTSLAETDKAYSPVVEAERLAQQAGAELTTLINALRPPGLEHKSLSTAIKEHVHEWARQNKIETEINIDSVTSLSVQAEQALFRVLQEALSNVARHSKAKKTTVTLKSENAEIKLTVEDNGIGFDAERVAKGVGLDSMKERLAAVNGTLEVSSPSTSLRTGLQSQSTRIVATLRRS